MSMNAHSLLLALTLLLAFARATSAGSNKEAVFSSVPDPDSVKLFFPPPASIEGSIIAVDDPFEPFNRRMYRFNAHFDRWVFLPVVNGYRFVMPDFAEKGVSNFFANLREIRNFGNNALQFKGKDTLLTGARFLVNSTLGIAGLFDPATRMGLLRREEDFGQTLGHWGVGAGPYLVLPLLGPSGLRDAGGLGVDFAVAYAADPLDVNGDADKDAERIGLNLLNAVDTRANTAFRYYETGSPFEYVLVRYAYTRMREIKVQR
jgi:phospholipid-binding lipoprotein MlaA